MNLRTTVLTSALAAVVALASCSSSTDKNAKFVGEAGTAGDEDSVRGAGDAGHGAGATGGRATPEGGVGGQVPVDMAGAAGEAGAPAAVVTIGMPTILFTVARGAKGLPGSAIASQAHPESVIFGSTTANVDPISGTNTVVVTAAELGIADGDVIDAFALPQAAPTAPTYAFSIAGTAPAGTGPTRLARSAADHEAPGDVYFSDLSESFRYVGGESGTLGGYNALIADEQTLGLSFTPHDQTLDDLTGVQLLPSGMLSTAVYFAVSSAAAGLPGSAVAAATAATRGCTVFKSNLDGTNSAVMGCADLGLADNAQLKGLTVYTTDTAISEVLFALSPSSLGLAGTAVTTAATGGEASTPNVQNNIYASVGKGTNAVRASGEELGLLHDDAIDALAVYSRAAAYYGNKTSCTLTPSPESAAGPNFVSLQNAHGLGDHLFLLIGGSHLTNGEQSVPPADLAAAYDAKTCKLVSSASLPFNTLSFAMWAAVPLAGWSAADPLKNIQYWRLDIKDETEPGYGTVGLDRISADGQTITSFQLDGLLYPETLDYDPLHNRFFISGDPDPNVDGSYYYRISFAAPEISAPEGTLIPVLRTPLPHPCAYNPTVSGVDAAGNSVYGELDSLSENPSIRLCALTATGEMADLPATWLDAKYSPWNLVVPGVAMYSLITDPAYTVSSSTPVTAPIPPAH